MHVDVGAAIVIVAIIAIILYRAALLTASGVAALVLIGSAVSLRLGNLWLLVLACLFLIAIGATRLHAARTGGFKSKAGRDALDLLPVGTAVVIGSIVPSSATGGVVVLTAMSFALADILASELGPLASRSAILLPSGRRVPHGVPGAVSEAGIGFGLVGSACAASIALVWAGPVVGGIVLVSGQLGAVLDTALSQLVRPGLSRRNDLINAAAVLAAVACALVFLQLLGSRGRPQ
jgi:uncharacterized membrane protein